MPTCQNSVNLQLVLLRIAVHWKYVSRLTVMQPEMQYNVALWQRCSHHPLWRCLLSPCLRHQA